MNKIVINLNPHKENATGALSESLFAYTPLLGLVAGAVFLILCILLIVLAFAGRTLGHKTGEWKQWESKAREVQALKSEISSLDESYAKLTQSATPRYEIGRIFEDMYGALPKNIWFESLKFNEAGLTVAGYVVRWNQDYLVSLNTFIDGLRSKEYFGTQFPTVNIQTSQKVEYNSLEVLKFVIECKK